jgi:hypothetical protein
MVYSTTPGAMTLDNGVFLWFGAKYSAKREALGDENMEEHSFGGPATSSDLFKRKCQYYQDSDLSLRNDRGAG